MFRTGTLLTHLHSIYDVDGDSHMFGNKHHMHMDQRINHWFGKSHFILTFLLSKPHIYLLAFEIYDLASLFGSLASVALALTWVGA